MERIYRQARAPKKIMKTTLKGLLMRRLVPICLYRQAFLVAYRTRMNYD